MNRKKLSVIVITYNHEKYIRQALDSILMQHVNFDYEILIGDDASTDGTSKILREYRNKYPDLIRLKIWKKNQGPTRNDYFLKMHAEGEYIAQLEGDDYWTDPEKLQIQVDFLEKHKDYIGCTHEFEVVDQYGNTKQKLATYDVLTQWMCKSRKYTINDVTDWTMPGHTGTYVYRNFFRDIDFSILYKAHRFVGDRTMSMLLALQGNVYRINRRMGVYRFVLKDKGVNWFSLENSNYYTLYDFFFYIRKLEKYAMKQFNVELDIRKEKKHDLIEQLTVFCYNPTFAFGRCVADMIFHSGDIIYYLYYTLINIPYRFYLSSVMGAVQQTQKCRDYNTSNQQLSKPRWKQVNSELRYKKLVLFGAGANCKAFLRKYYYRYHPDFIADNDSSRWGTSFHGVIIRPPEELKNYNSDDVIVLITISEYMEQIAEQLDGMDIKNYYSFPNIEYKKPYYWFYRIIEYYKNKYTGGKL